MLDNDYMHACFASCAKGIESLLTDELNRLGATEIKETVSGVSFQSDLSTLYRSCLWSRLASRIYLTLATFSVKTAQDIYDCASQITWDAHFNVNQAFLVDFIGTNQEISNTQFGALTVKDAIADFFQKKYNCRPNVSKQQAQCKIHARLHHGHLYLSLDMVGRPLHERGYRKASGFAPLKENLAAAMLARSGWQPNQPFLDPMCGSGTLVIEAALQAAQVAPGLNRDFLFEDWKQHDPDIWFSLRDEAIAIAREGIAQCKPCFFARDIDVEILEKAKENAKNAGVADLIDFQQQHIRELTPPSDFQQGVVVINPPYGERLADQVSAIVLYYQLGARLRQAFTNAHCAVLCPDQGLLSCLRMRTLKKYRLFNGALACELRIFALSQGTSSKVDVAEDFANRLRKNIKARQKWLEKTDTNAYRIYDADLPDYNLAIDRYADYLVVQEYARPPDVPEVKSQQRLYDALYQCSQIIDDVPTTQIVLKTRQRQRGNSQYHPVDDKGQLTPIYENGVKLYANLYDYLDTGIFLDHRPIRAFIQQQAYGKRFLNLFCYTGVATVHAAVGGARATVSVDLSKTYLARAKQNLQLNQQDGSHHRLIHADCIDWIKDCHDQFDLIFLDPPTFSNSKRMHTHFEVQADYLTLLSLLAKILSDGGMLIFSNNKRGFKLDESAVKQLGFTLDNISAQSIPEDFKRRRNIHQCWLLHKQSTINKK